MKKIIIILLLLLGSTTLFCQTRADGIIEYKIDRQDVPYRIAPASSLTRDSEIWRPLKGYGYWYPGEPRYDYSFRYDTTGVLQQENMRYMANLSRIAYIATYNQTFTKKGFDFLDTITYYQVLPETEYIPEGRTYCDYHYYDRYPQDSFYYVEYTEGWNNITQEWEMQHKRYLGHFDTTLFVIRESSLANYINGEWVKYYGVHIIREYNEDGLVTANIIQRCNPQTGEYEMWRKFEFFYDEDDVHIESYLYSPTADGWRLFFKHTDIEYTEWYPNSQPGITIEVLNGPEYLGVADIRVKEKSYTGWRLKDNDKWEEELMDKHAWDLNGTKTHIDSLFLFYDDAWQLKWIDGEFYDERDDFILKWAEGLLSDGTFWSRKDYILITYHPIYDECESLYHYNRTYQEAIQDWDSVFLELIEYFDWHDVTQPVSITEPEPLASATLSIFPNPVSGVVTIAAASEMQQLSIFDIMGRLVASPSPAGERVVFDTGALPQGVYIVRALLRDGGVRTGKVVAR